MGKGRVVDVVEKGKERSRGGVVEEWSCRILLEGARMFLCMMV